MKRVSVFLIVVTLIAGMVGYGGSCEGYYPPPSQNLEIRDWYDLDAVRDNLSGHHTLGSNLNSTTPGYEELASPTANGGKGWQPIGFFGPKYGYGSPNIFWGTFDGQGHEIRDMFINRPDESDVGLFGIIQGVIGEISVVNCTVTGNRSVGGLLGSNAGTVNKCYCSGEISGDEYIGGLVGLSISGGVVTYSYSTSIVIGNLQVGGLAGRNTGNVSSCYATGNVIGVDDVDGLVGYSNYGTVSNSCSTGNVTGYSDVGGLVGNNRDRVGYYDYGAVRNSFWDTETSGQATSDGGTGKNTTEMQDIDTFSGAAWSITAVANTNMRDPLYIWNIVNNVTYPFLSWQTVS